MITDVRGKEVKVGDTVAFAGGGRGASEFYVGKVIRITNKCVQIEVERFGNHYVSGKGYVEGYYFDKWQRNEGMFAILESV